MWRKNREQTLLRAAVMFFLLFVNESRIVETEKSKTDAEKSS